MPENTITPHFTWAELNPRDDATPFAAANLTRLANRLESVRSILGVPMRITSGYRSPEYNRKVGGSSTSSHVYGEAADFVPIGLTMYKAHKLLKANADLIGPFDQIIYYPASGHIHIGIGAQLRREFRIRLAENYPFLTQAKEALLPGSGTSSTIVLVALVALAVALAVSNA